MEQLAIKTEITTDIKKTFQIIITGGAYMQVKRPDNVIVFTQSRQFFIDKTGLIVTAEGYNLIQKTIVPEPFNEPIAINKHGEISVFRSGTWEDIGQIMAVLFQNPNGLIALGNGYYGQTTQAGQPHIDTPKSRGLFAHVFTFYIPKGLKKQRLYAVLSIPSKTEDFVVKARKILNNIMNNKEGYFTNLTSTLVDITNHINTLETIEEWTKQDIEGSAPASYTSYNKVLIAMRGLQRQVQTLADNAVDTLATKEIISASGFEMKSHSINNKDALEVRQGRKSGNVVLLAETVAGAGAFEWQVSDDIVKWSNLPATLSAKTKVSGLISNKTYYFRCRPVKKTGIKNWSHAVSINVE